MTITSELKGIEKRRGKPADTPPRKGDAAKAATQAAVKDAKAKKEPVPGMDMRVPAARGHEVARKGPPIC